MVELTQTTHTSADAAAALGVDVGQIAKSLVFLAGDEPVLVVASGANRVDTAKVAAALGVPPLKRAGADAVHAATGYRVGGVSPVGLARPLRVVVDRDLARYAQLWAAAGTANAVFPTSYDELLRLTGGLALDVAEAPRPTPRTTDAAGAG